MGWLYVFDVDGKKLAVYKNGDRAEVNKEILDSAHVTIKSIYPRAKFLPKPAFRHGFWTKQEDLSGKSIKRKGRSKDVKEGRSDRYG